MRNIVALLAMCSLGAQTAPPDHGALEKIRTRMLSHLDHQPNYTCLETIERSSRAKPYDKFDVLDTLRLEVALFNGREMFSWVGSNKFEEFSTTAKVVNGAIGTGDFGLHALSLFASGAATFHDPGEADFQGKRALRFDYTVPQALSEYRIRVQNASAIVGYHGTLYANLATFDVERIEIIADQFPSGLSLSRAEDKIDYAAARIGDDDFLLPAQSELAMFNRSGGEEHNLVKFTACRRFPAESAAEFAPVAPAKTDAASIRAFDLPPSLDVVLSLTQEVDLRTAVVGDPVHARVERDVKQKGQIVIPKGAIATGRITRFEKYSDFSVLGLEFPEIAAPGILARMKGRLDHILCVENVTAYAYTIKGQKPQQPGEALIPMNATQLRLVRGCFLYWKS
jgi:hypothetical protein